MLSNRVGAGLEHQAGCSYHAALLQDLGRTLLESRCCVLARVSPAAATDNNVGICSPVMSCVQLANSFGLLIMQIVPNFSVPDLLMLPAEDVGASYRLLAALLC